MKVEKDTLYLFRALIKISSALCNIDVLKKDKKKYKNILKKTIHEWETFMEINIKDPVYTLHMADEEATLDLINLFGDIDEIIFIEDDFKTNINLLLAKAYSAYNDLSKISVKNSLYIADLKRMLYWLTTRPLFKEYISFVDVDKNTFESIVKIMDDTGNGIVMGTTN